MNKYIIKNNKISKYYCIFNKKNGFMMRNGYDGIEPFMRLEGPELLDISITNYCENNCDFCYRKSNVNGKHMSLENYKNIIKQASDLGVMQVALGGGNPNQHPDFIEILKITRELGIIPSYTTNGIGLTEEVLKASKEFCGAVAVSLYEPYTESYEAIMKLINNKIKTNIHFILSSKTIDNAIKLLNKIPKEIEGINAIIFLNYKPQNESDRDNLKNTKKISEFFHIINHKILPFKVGFDSCSISFLVKEVNDLNIESVDFCEAGRFSAFISEEMKMYPCSFMINKIKGEDLHIKDIENVWTNGEDFKLIREKINNNNCGKCKYFDICHGGCKIFEINSKDCISLST